MARRTILITGAAGVIGTALLPHLREEPVICMTRATGLAPTGFPVDVVSGDVARPDLGLDPAAYRDLAARVDLVVHSAALTDWAAPAEDLRRANVDGTRHVVEFCRRAGAQIVHIGTAFTQALRPDAPLAIPPENTIVNYVGAKRDANAIVRESGLEATLVHPTNLVGETTTGWAAATQIMQLTSEYILRGKVPYLQTRKEALVDVVPQDTVGAALAAICLHEPIGGEYWLTAGADSMSLDEMVSILVEFAAEIGRPIKRPEAVDPADVATVAASLPPAKRALFILMAHLADGMVACEMFPTSLPELRERYDLPYLPPAAAFRKSLAYSRSQSPVG